jgi:Mn2+/Fe2+ NRAMP family transporter
MFHLLVVMLINCLVFVMVLTPYLCFEAEERKGLSEVSLWVRFVTWYTCVFLTQTNISTVSKHYFHASTTYSYFFIYLELLLWKEKHHVIIFLV